MILKVARMGHPVLRERAREVRPDELRSGVVARLVEDMFETMGEYEGVGLAAPQVHVSARVVVLEVPAGLRAPDDPGLGPMPLINPVVTPLAADEMENWEGCLSIPGMIGRVPRPRRIRLDWLDLEGREHSEEIEGFPAAAVQHECDHLDGVLYVDRIRDLRTFQFTEEFQRYGRGKR